MGRPMKERVAEAQETVNKIESLVNNFGFDTEAVAVGLRKTHPTLQQGVMRFAVAFIREMAKEGWVDGRNQAAHELAKKLAAVIGEDGGYLPFI